MANPHKGEYAFEAAGKNYTLLFSVDALCALEAATGKGIAILSMEMANPQRSSVTLLRQMVWAGLREKHPDIDIKAAGELIVSAGGFMPMMRHIDEAFSMAFPFDAVKPDGAANPQEGQPQKDGTGPASTPTGAG